MRQFHPAWPGTWPAFPLPCPSGRGDLSSSGFPVGSWSVVIVVGRLVRKLGLHITFLRRWRVRNAYVDHPGARKTGQDGSYCRIVARIKKRAFAPGGFEFGQGLPAFLPGKRDQPVPPDRKSVV